MGLIGRIKEILSDSRNGDFFSEYTVDAGGGPPVTAQAMSVPGLDAKPLPADAVYYCEAGSVMVACATADTSQAQEADDGETILYSRSANGQRVARLILRKDGTVEITGEGDVTINGAVIDTSGNVTTAKGISLDDHVHGYIDSKGSAATPTPSDTTAPDTPAVAP